MLLGQHNFLKTKIFHAQLYVFPYASVKDQTFDYMHSQIHVQLSGVTCIPWKINKCIYVFINKLFWFPPFKKFAPIDLYIYFIATLLHYITHFILMHSYLVTYTKRDGLLPITIIGKKNSILLSKKNFNSWLLL